MTDTSDLTRPADSRSKEFRTTATTTTSGPTPAEVAALTGTERQDFDTAIDPDIVTDPATPKATIYCIKTCSTCREANKALEAAGYAVHYRDLRGADIGLADFQYLADALGWESMVNKRSTTWRNLPAKDREDLTRDSALDLLVKNPTLMKRPAIDLGNRVLLGWTGEVRAELGVDA